MDLVPGTYKVAFRSDEEYYSTTQNSTDDEKNSDVEAYKSAKDGWIESKPIDVYSSSANKVVLDAGFIEDLCLGDFVWYDKNLNGLQDEGEAGIVGIEVQLLTLDNTPSKRYLWKRD